jgi:hypothetical protein
MPDMLVKLYDLPNATDFIAALAEEEVIIRQARAYEKHTVVNWVREFFGPGWGSECEVAFSNHPVSCYIATEKGVLLGFACYESTCKNFFGPTGVIMPARTRGIGRALLLSCLHAMQAEGYAYAIIGGVGPQAFYKKVAGAIEIPDSTPGIYRDMLEDT